MQIFLKDTNYGTSASMIPLIVFSITFFYVVTYNANRAGKIKDDITDEIMVSSWEDVIKTRDKMLGNYEGLEELEGQLADAIAKMEAGETTYKVGGGGNAVKINPKESPSKNKNDES